MITKSSDDLTVINWSTPQVLAFSTTRLIPTKTSGNTLKNISNSEKTTTVFDNFNLGDHVGDCAIKVKKNRTSLLSLLPNGTKIQWLEQVHGDHVAYIDEVHETPIVADAVITREKNIALSIMTADCLPILITDKNGREIAAIHAGWRPLAKNIIEKTINKMQTPADELRVWLGPCIGPEAFEVGVEVRQKFIHISEKFSDAFSLISNENSSSSSSNKFIANLAKIALLQLETLGVTNTSHTNECTYSQSDKYYSFRRDGKTGRMASIIVLT